MSDQWPPVRHDPRAIERYGDVMRRQAAVAAALSGGYSLWNGRWEETFGVLPEGIVVDADATSLTPDGTLRLSGPQVTRPIWEACRPRDPRQRRDAATLTRARAAYQMLLTANVRALSQALPPEQPAELAGRRADAAGARDRPDAALRIGAGHAWVASHVDPYIDGLGLDEPGIHEVRAREHRSTAHYTGAAGILAADVSRHTGRDRDAVLGALALSAPGTEYGVAADLMLGDLRGTVPAPAYDEARRRVEAAVRSQFSRLRPAGQSSQERRLTVMAAGHGAAAVGRAAHAELLERFGTTADAAPTPRREEQSDLFRSARAAFGGTQPAPGSQRPGAPSEPGSTLPNRPSTARRPDGRGRG
ncbi:MAG TPA: hypothetical protein VGJ44_02020 [Kribbellaceae bacterium]|jgi:hypothetical protein